MISFMRMWIKYGEPYFLASKKGRWVGYSHKKSTASPNPNQSWYYRKERNWGAIGLTNIDSIKEQILIFSCPEEGLEAIDASYKKETVIKAKDFDDYVVEESQFFHWLSMQSSGNVMMASDWRVS